MYILDTNVCIDLMAANRQVISQMADLGSVRVCISAVTLAELLYGAERSVRPDHEAAQVRKLQRNFIVLPVDARVATQYAALKARLALCGQLLEDNDLFIAATALARGYVLVTHDKGFNRIPELTIEKWR